MSHWLYPDIPGWVAGHGQEAVSAFFVLSGLVVAYSMDARPDDWSGYAIARAARLYTVVIPALLLSMLLDRAGSHINPAWYADHIFGLPGPDLYHLTALLTFTNELWFSHVLAGTTEPFWSLGFEAPYYTVFGIILFTRGRMRRLGTAIWALVAGPQLLLYLPMWLGGVWLWRLIRDDRINFKRPVALLLLALLPICYGCWWSSFGELPAQYAWLPSFGAVLVAGYHMVVAVLVGLAIAALAVLTKGSPAFAPAIAIPIRRAAGASFTLYLIHQPILSFACAVLPPQAGPLARGLAVIMLLVITALMATLSEQARRDIVGRFTARRNDALITGEGDGITVKSTPVPESSYAPACR